MAALLILTLAYVFVRRRHFHDLPIDLRSRLVTVIPIGRAADYRYFSQLASVEGVFALS